MPFSRAQLRSCFLDWNHCSSHFLGATMGATDAFAPRSCPNVPDRYAHQDCEACRESLQDIHADGLYIEVPPSGSKRWRFKYRLDGKEKRISLGTYPRSDCGPHVIGATWRGGLSLKAKTRASRFVRDFQLCQKTSKANFTAKPCRRLPKSGLPSSSIHGSRATPVSMDFRFDGENADMLRYGAFRRSRMRRRTLGTAYVIPVFRSRRNADFDIARS